MRAWLKKHQNNGSPELQVVLAVSEWESMQGRNMSFFFKTLNKDNFDYYNYSLLLILTVDIFVQLTIHHNRNSISRIFKKCFWSPMPPNASTLMMNSQCSHRVDCCNCFGWNSQHFDYWRQGQCSHSPLVQEVVLVLHWSLDPEPGAQHMLDGEWNMPAGGRCRGSPPFQPPQTWGRRGA